MATEEGLCSILAATAPVIGDGLGKCARGRFYSSPECICIHIYTVVIRNHLQESENCLDHELV